MSEDVFTSNSLDFLVEKLKKNLLLNKTAFADQRLFLPSPFLKDKLLQEFLSDEGNTTAGVAFEGLESGALSLFHSLTDQRLLFPTRDLMALHLEALILEKKSFSLSISKKASLRGKNKKKPRGSLFICLKSFC